MPGPQPKYTETLDFTLEPRQKAEIKAVARRLGMSVSSMMRMAAEAFVEGIRSKEKRLKK